MYTVLVENLDKSMEQLTLCPKCKSLLVSDIVADIDTYKAAVKHLHRTGDYDELDALPSFHRVGYLTENISATANVGDTIKCDYCGKRTRITRGPVIPIKAN